MRGRTHQVGSKTQNTTRYSPLAVANKDPAFDYSWQRRREIEDGGGVNNKGWIPIDATNTNGETWDGPKEMMGKTQGSQLRNEDTVLCKRPKSVSAWLKSQEDEAYNAQARFVQSAAKNAQAELRKIDPNAVVSDRSEGMEKAFTQRTGPTEEER